MDWKKLLLKSLLITASVILTTFSEELEKYSPKK